MPSLPNPKPIKDLFQDLLGRTVNISSIDTPVVPTARRACCVGTYVDPQGTTTALMVADLDLAARAGAALGLVPVSGATTAVENRELPGALYDNFHEVLNICASLFNTGHPDENVKLDVVYQPGTVIPTQVAMQLRGLGRRADYQLEIDSYGTGALGVVVPL